MAETTAIFEPEAVDRIFAACQDDVDWGIAFCCLRCGMHPTQIRRLKAANLGKDGILRWIRVKNERPMEYLVPPDERDRLRQFLSSRKYTREGIWKRTKALTARAGYAGGPRVLRKTFILNELRRLGPGSIELVAMKAGCGVTVVMRHYLLLRDWEAIFMEKR